MKGVGVKVDGVMLLVLVALASVFYLFLKSGSIKKSIGDALNRVNPASSENVVYKAVDKYGVKGGIGGYSYDDYFFALTDYVNPFNRSDEYARQVLGVAK